MTSGFFTRVALDSIIVQRDRRQRREPDPTAIDELADSIRRLGLIHPPVITRDNVLVAGECRTIACKQLGWTHIPIQYVDELSEADLYAIELEENVKRRDIPWQDQVDAVSRYHELMRNISPSGWLQEQTAEAIGLSPRRVRAMLSVAEEISRGTERVATVTNFSTAEGIARRARERRDEAALSGLREAPATVSDEEKTILNVSFHDWTNEHEAPRFNFIHCDFPYGIEADAFPQGGSDAHGGYADTRSAWVDLMETLAHTTKYHTTPSAHLMFWFAMRKRDERLYEPTIQALEGMGWDINPLPLIWMKSDGAGIIPDPERGPRQIYETCLFGSRGDRRIVRSVANAYAAPTVRERHMSEKPEPMLRHFFQMFVDENTIMLDPTCGSGSALRAAESLNAKYTLGLELSGEFSVLARDALKRSRQLKRANQAMEKADA